MLILKHKRTNTIIQYPKKNHKFKIRRLKNTYVCLIKEKTYKNIFNYLNMNEVGVGKTRPLKTGQTGTCECRLELSSPN